MLYPDETAYEKPLPNGLTLRTVSTTADLDKVAELDGIVHGEGVREMTRKLFSQHPDVSGRDLVSIDNGTGESIATLCLIPWTLQYGPVQLKAGELGIVATLERYRNQGLNRVLMEYFWQRFAEQGCVLSIIQGIPYFYRQYGYEYAMVPLVGGLRIQPDQLPEPVTAGYRVRAAVMADIPLLVHLYDELARAQELSACRSAAIWEYLLSRTAQPEDGQHDTFILEDPNGSGVGYFRIPDFHFDMNLLTIDEVSAVRFDEGLAVFQHLKQLAAERGKEGIKLQLPQNCGLMKLAKSFEARDMGVYSWQIRIPDPAAFLRQVGPLLEARIAGSMFAGLTGTYSLNLYKTVIGLTFQEGRLEAVGPGKEDERTVLNVPPTQFVPLVLGGRTMAEIHAAFPDAFANGPWGLLVDTLFPRVDAYLTNQY